MALTLSDTVRNAMADAAVDSCEDGVGNAVLAVYGGAQPAGPGTATAEAVLCEFDLGATAFGNAGAVTPGVASLANTPLATTGDASGTATWFRIYQSADGTVAGAGTALIDGAVGTSGAELNLNTTTISVGVNVEISSGDFTMPAA